MQLGRDVYATYCVGCHGEKGDGAGPAARFLDPKPRDFRLGKLKFANVPSGEPPRDEDYEHTIIHGLMGTAMPAFPLITQQERTALVAYVRAFAVKKQGSGTLLSIGRDPFAKDPTKGIEEGRKAYHVIGQCWSCHAAYEPWSEIDRLRVANGMPSSEMPTDLFTPKAKDSEWGTPIRPPDFLTDRIKTGTSVETLAQVIGAGVGGTAMPTWAGVLEPKQIWGLAYYVRSLALLRGTAQADDLQRSLTATQPGSQ
jgi:mono/diheme cytochrome c family protein